jgi:hypothetical protein
VRKPPRVAKPRIELDPAFQQATALPAELRRTLTELSRNLIELRRTLTDLRCTLLAKTGEASTGHTQRRKNIERGKDG